MSNFPMLKMGTLLLLIVKNICMKENKVALSGVKDLDKQTILGVEEKRDRSKSTCF